MREECWVRANTKFKNRLFYLLNDICRWRCFRLASGWKSVLFLFLYFCVVDKLLSNEDGGGIFDDPPAITESVMMPQDHGDDDDDFDALSGQFHKFLRAKIEYFLVFS